MTQIEVAGIKSAILRYSLCNVEFKFTNFSRQAELWYEGIPKDTRKDEELNSDPTLLNQHSFAVNQAIQIDRTYASNIWIIKGR